MGYENLNILRSYKTNKNDIVREFYVPVLKQSVLYKRAVGFLSSTALIELSKGIASVSMSTNTPVLFGVLTTDTIEQAIERAGTKAGNKGSDAAKSAIEMANLAKSMNQKGKK